MEIGQTLNQRYTLAMSLGRGAMGTVYRALDAKTGQDVAVKVLSQELTLDPDILERFRREGDTLRQLRHPNIVGYVDTFVHAGQHVIVMEYVPGGNLHVLIRQGPLPIDRARRIALGLCDALTRAHELNIIHRDIKPENILLAEDGTAKLTDFGVARLLEAGTKLTGTGTQVGTPFYMAPEAWEGTPLDAQADIWALGVVLFEMLTGQVPFGGETLIAVMNKVLNAPLPDLRERRAEVPPGLAKIVETMLTRDKGRRYASIRRVAADLEQGEATAVARPTVAQRAAPAKRRLLLWAAIVGIPVVALLALGFLQWVPGLVPGWPATVTPTIPATAVPSRTPVPNATVPPTSPPSSPTQAPAGPAVTTAEAGQSLVFQDGDIMISDGPDHYTPLALAGKIDNVMGLTWAPDGQRFAFTACLPGEVKAEGDNKKCNFLYVARRDGSELNRVAPLGGVLGLAWSPDGEWIAYGNGSLNLIRPDGSDGRIIVTGSDTWGTWNTPAWSPDSQWLAYQINECSGGGCYSAHSVAVASAQGGQTQTIFDLSTAQLGYGGPLAWGPDGASVVAADEKGGAYLIWVNCLKSPEGCSAPLPWEKKDHVPRNWLPDFYPQWAPDQIAPAIPVGLAHVFAEPILTAIAGQPPDFTDDFSRTDSGWPVETAPPGDEFGYQDGAYVVSNLNPPCRGGANPAMPLTTDFVLTVDVRVLSGAGTWAIIYRASRDGRAHSGFDIDTDGTFQFHKNVEGVHIVVSGPHPIPASALKPGDAVNRLTLVARGAYVAALLNDEPLGMIEDYSSSGGDVQLANCVKVGSSQPLRVAFDNLKIWSLAQPSSRP